MRLYDRICPICGYRNTGLYLEETGGYMECEKCGSITKGLPCAKNGDYSVPDLHIGPEALKSSVIFGGAS